MVFTSRFRAIRLLRFLSASKLFLGLVTINYIREVSRVGVKPLFCFVLRYRIFVWSCGIESEVSIFVNTLLIVFLN